MQLHRAYLQLIYSAGSTINMVAIRVSTDTDTTVYHTCMWTLITLLCLKLFNSLMGTGNYSAHRIIWSWYTDHLASYDTSLVVSGGVDCGRRRRNVYDKKPQPYAKDSRTAHLTACSDKSVAYVTNNKRLYSTFCTIEANYWQTRSIARPLCDSRATCLCRLLTGVLISVVLRLRIK